MPDWSIGSFHQKMLSFKVDLCQISAQKTQIPGWQVGPNTPSELCVCLIHLPKLLALPDLFCISLWQYRSSLPKTCCILSAFEPSSSLWHWKWLTWFISSLSNQVFFCPKYLQKPRWILISLWMGNVDLPSSHIFRKGGLEEWWFLPWIKSKHWVQNTSSKSDAWEIVEILLYY